jgi:hypothetical protein
VSGSVENGNRLLRKRNQMELNSEERDKI